MEGGIEAWRGLLAAGPPEGGMAYFAPATRPEEMIALAWYLESGSRAFYAALASPDAGRADADLYEQLGREEADHQAALSELYLRVAGDQSPANFSRALARQESPDALMEGGVEVAAALRWAKGRPAAELLEYCISLESNSYDLYLKLRAATAKGDTRKVFDLLAAGEKVHLEGLTARLEQLLEIDERQGGKR